MSNNTNNTTSLTDLLKRLKDVLASVGRTRLQLA